MSNSSHSNYSVFIDILLLIYLSKISTILWIFLKFCKAELSLFIFGEYDFFVIHMRFTSWNVFLIYVSFISSKNNKVKINWIVFQIDFVVTCIKYFLYNLRFLQCVHYFIIYSVLLEKLSILIITQSFKCCKHNSFS